MRLRPLTQLRLAFAALGLVLLTPIGFLLSSVNDRLEGQRRLRHEVVAERIFDELERELTDLLEQESARPSEAYDATDTRMASWGPFVVGYFKTSASGYEFLADEQLDPERKQRLRWAVAEWDKRNHPESARPRASGDDGLKSLAPVSPKSSPEILRQLNRADVTRQKSLEPKKPPADPMQDLL